MPTRHCDFALESQEHSSSLVRIMRFEPFVWPTRNLHPKQEQAPRGDLSA
jgi:hypothetical protein